LIATLVGCGEDPRPSEPITLGSGEFGDACERTEDCASGLCVRVGEMQGQCSKPCLDAAQCPSAPNWACVTDQAVDTPFCACRSVGNAEVCGDGLDNDCDGAGDDCRMCGGEPVADNDPKHCRSCDNACRGDQICEDEGCECPKTKPDDCDGACTDVSDDLENCGECGVVCSPGQLCTDGECDCPAATPDACELGCVDFANDGLNCGACGNACELGLVCTDGECACPYSELPTWCGSGSGCRDLQTDPLACGSCDVVCSGGTICSEGECVCPAAGAVPCDGVGCVDLSSDAGNCGACGAVCALGTVCDGAECVCPNADAPDFCDGIGCVDFGSTERHCGACGNECGFGSTCVDAACECDEGFAACGDECADLNVNRDHCGACGNACGTGQVCRSGSCNCTDVGTAMCGDGCADLWTDTDNCGECGNACAQGELCDYGECYCEGRTCSGVCQPWNDEQNCGACGVVCQAGQYCDGEMCRCDGSGLAACGERCEDLYSSETACGACDVACRPGETCSYGSCQCPWGQTYCASAGRCVALASDAASCGTCGNACRPGEICSSGVCRCSSTSQRFCASANTCVSIYTDAQHCGACDAACDPGEVCASGSCQCPSANHSYCASEGTCVSIYANDEHCGACDQACPAESHCSGFGCVCDDAAEALCDDVCVNLGDDEANCGSCGNVCDGNQVCTNGQCGCPAPSVATPLRLTNNAVDDLRPSLAWDGVHVGLAYLRYDRVTSTGEVRFALLNPDGTLVSDTSVSDSPNNVSTYSYVSGGPSLVWSGTEYGLSWYAYPTGTQFVRLDAAGTLKGVPSTVANSIGSSLAWSPAYGGYALAGSTALQFRRLGADASAPEAPNAFTPLNSLASDAVTALVAMPDGGFTMAYREQYSVGFAVFNADGSRTLPLSSVPAYHQSPRETNWPSVVLHAGALYTTFVTDWGQQIGLNRGTQTDLSTLAETVDGSGILYADPTLAVVRDSLALSFAERSSETATASRFRLARFSLPVAATPKLLHAVTNIEAAQTASSGSTAIIVTGDSTMLAVWADERWGFNRELYVAPVEMGACP
jgi:hypothetical protein